MKVALLLIIAYITASSSARSLESHITFMDSEHGNQFSTNSYYGRILEELDGAHLRFAASHVSLSYKKAYNKTKLDVHTVPQYDDNCDYMAQAFKFT